MKSLLRLLRPGLSLAVVWLATSCVTQSFPPGEPCVADGFTVIDDFAAARRGTCTVQSNDQVVVDIRPESAGRINPSPWYAFKIPPHGADRAHVTLRYTNGKHRYPPKISSDGLAWQVLDEEFVSVGNDGMTADITVSLDDEPVWVAAEEIVPPKFYEAWGTKIARETGFSQQLLGHSLRGLDIHMFDTNPDLREVLLLTGRQHPPEVSGAAAFFEFAETILADTPLAMEFRERFRIIAIPMLNPDGVVAGNWRHNLAHTDLNRDWGPFEQPETKLISNLLDGLDTEGSCIRVFIDFHSTKENVFYTQHDATDPPGFTDAWLTAAAPHIEDYAFRNHNEPPKQLLAAKNYMYERYGIPSVTYEVGDETDREAVRKAARVFATELMRQMLELAPPATSSYAQ